MSGINLKEQEYSSSQNELTVEDKDKILRIDNKLPQIILPQSKIGMFIDWYNNDLRLLGTLPEAYNEGYLIIENDIIQGSGNDNPSPPSQGDNSQNRLLRS